jgi:hypothetical protein
MIRKSGHRFSDKIMLKQNSLRRPVNDYDPLRDYLKKQTLPEFVLSFEQIEEIIDAALPRAAQRASWWEPCAARRRKCRSVRRAWRPAISRQGRRTGRA